MPNFPLTPTPTSSMDRKILHTYPCLTRTFPTLTNMPTYPNLAWMPTPTCSLDRKMMLPTHPNLQTPTNSLDLVRMTTTTTPWMLLDQMPTPTCCLEKWTRRP